MPLTACGLGASGRQPTTITGVRAVHWLRRGIIVAAMAATVPAWAAGAGVRSHCAKRSLAGLLSPIWLDEEGRSQADCRIRSGFAFDRHNCYATGDSKWLSGPSRLSSCLSPSVSCQSILIRRSRLPWLAGGPTRSPRNNFKLAGRLGRKSHLVHHRPKKRHPRKSRAQ